MDLNCCHLHQKKQDFLLKSFLGTIIFWPKNHLTVFPSRITLKLNIPLTPKIVQEVIIGFDSSKTSGPVYISLVVLKNFEPDFWCMLVDIFNLCLNVVFHIIGKCHLWCLCLKFLGRFYLNVPIYQWSFCQ